MRKPKPLTVEYYKDVDQLWRWRFLRQAFGKTYIVADSAESYHNLKDAQDAVEHIRQSFVAGTVTGKMTTT